VAYERRDLLDVAAERNGRFDIVLAVNSLLHAGRPDTVRPYVRSLAPGGTLIVIDVVVDSPRRGGAHGRGWQYWQAPSTPRGGRWLVPRAESERFAAERRPPTVVMGYDLTCAAPTSVSLLWAFGDDRIRAAVLAALDAGVEAALGCLERHAAVGTVGGRTQPGLGLAAACYRHEVSRADEAHLHAHVVIANEVPIPLLDEDGRPGSTPTGWPS
jgi:hypothetical protein